MNPLSHVSKFGVSTDKLSPILGARAGSGRVGGKKGRDRSKVPKGRERAAMARPNFGGHSRRFDRMIVDSVTTSDITPMAEKVWEKKPYVVTISLADDPTIRLSHKWTRKVSFKGESYERKVCLSDTLVVPEAGMSLLSVASLTRKHVGVLFMPGFAVLFDLKDDCAVFGYTEQDSNALFYIRDDEGTSPRHTD